MSKAAGRGLQRYDRQMLIEGFGKEGQERLREAKVVVAGAGGLGCAASIYLAAAGVGKIRLIDHDRVELDNLNRQVLYGDHDIGRGKAGSARQKLESLNPEVTVEAVSETITEGSAFELVDGCDLIVDAMDNFATRYILNKVAINRGIPFFHGAVRGFEGRATTIVPGRTACLRCVYARAPQPEAAPVIGVAPAVIGSIQATEVIKYVAGIGELLTNRLLIYDGLSLEFMEMKLKRRPDCEQCQHLTEGRE
ncbi:MAG: HesA/MoeB/ThiF family protein [Dehalococcoidia bacterium]|nr:HesA/MoeB/ThiF family protein [Dehalococcoidia bacterium]